MDDMGESRKAGRRSARKPAGDAVCSPENMRKEQQIGIRFSLSGEDISVSFDLPSFCTDSQRVENAEKLGAFLAVINKGGMAPVMMYSLAKYGIVSQREPEAQHVLKTMHLAMGVGSDTMDEAPLVSPLDAFVVRRD
jgi:hypothetical protein